MKKEIKNLVSDEVQVIATAETEIGTFEYLSNGTLLNNDSIIVTDIPSYACIDDVIEMCLMMYSDCGCIFSTYDLLVDFIKNQYIEKWVVIAKCSDGDVVIHKDGKIAFDIDIANEIAKDHQNMGIEIEIMQYTNYTEKFGINNK